MTRSAQPERRKSGPGDRRLGKWGPWAGLGLAVACLVLLALVGPNRLLASLAALSAPRGEGPLSLTIVHSNDTWGYVYPCGWREPLGGAARRASKFQEARATSEHVLLLDAGNSLVSSAGSSPYEPAARTRGETSVQILNRLGYDAVALGTEDLALGKQELRRRLAEARGFDFLSANLLDSDTGALLVRPYVIKSVGGHRIALIGITGGKLPQERSGEFSLLPPLDAARRYVRQVQSQADIVILLSNAGAEANKVIAGQVPGIDLIISGGQDPLAEPVEPVRGTLVVQADLSSPGHAGRLLGKLQAQFDRAGTLTGHAWENIPLDPSVPADPAMEVWIESLPQP